MTCQSALVYFKNVTYIGVKSFIRMSYSNLEMSYVFITKPLAIAEQTGGSQTQAGQDSTQPADSDTSDVQENHYISSDKSLVLLQTTTFKIENSVFQNGLAYNGGAISIENKLLNSPLNQNISNCVFINNSVTFEGGSVQFMGQGIVLNSLLFIKGN